MPPTRVNIQAGLTAEAYSPYIRPSALQFISPNTSSAWAVSEMTGNELLHTQGVYIDVELTCWPGSPPAGMKQEIIEIGAVAMNLASLDITLEASYFVRPRRWEISSKCTMLTGITKEDIQSAPPFQDVLAEFIDAFDPKGKLCGTWGADDATLIEQACQAAGLKSPLRYLVDVGQLFQRAFLLKQQTSLQKAVKLLGLQFNGVPHSAVADARNTALIHAAIIRRMRREPEPVTAAPHPEPAATAKLSAFGEKLSRSLGDLQKD